MANEDLSFDSLEPKYRNVTIGARRFKLQQGSYFDLVNFRTESVKNPMFNPDGSIQFLPNYHPARLTLLSQCLVEQKDTGNEPVSQAELKTWPDPLMNSLFDALEEINGLKINKTREELIEQINELNKRVDLIDNMETNLKNS